MMNPYNSGDGNHFIGQFQPDLHEQNYFDAIRRGGQSAMGRLRLYFARMARTPSTSGFKATSSDDGGEQWDGECHLHDEGGQGRAMPNDVLPLAL